MNATKKIVLGVVLTVAAVLLLLFGGGVMSGATMSGGMMGHGAMGGISWMWIPTVLALGLGVFVVLAVFRPKG